MASVKTYSGPASLSMQPPQCPPKPPEVAECDLSDEWEHMEEALPLPYDMLSKITEGSNEAGSGISSVFFSAVSGATSRRSSKPSKHGASLGSGLPLCLLGGLHLNAGLGVGGSLPTPARSGTRPQKLQAIQEAPDLRPLVKGFVESAVRGCYVEAICGNGRTQPVIFRLSRKVDSFELASRGDGTSCTVPLADVAAVRIGDESWVKRELYQLATCLDSSCAVLQLFDGRCLTLRFHDCTKERSEAQASAFVLCMQSFATELQGQS